MMKMKENIIALMPAWSVEAFAQRVQQITQQFEQEQVRSVGLWFEDAAQFACVLLACFRAGVNVLLPPNLLEENRQWIAENANLLLDDNRFATYGVAQRITQIQPLAELISQYQGQSQVWMKTSGSSGNAKILIKTAEQLWREATEVGKFLPLQMAQLHVAGTVSVQHFYGLTYRVLIPLWHRSLGRNWTIGRIQQTYPDYLIAESLQTKPTLWITSPALLSRLPLSDPQLANCRLAAIISSGGALDQQLGLALQQALNAPVLEGYGSTETGCIAFRQPTEHWQPLLDIELGVNEQGALWVQSSRTNGREQTADAVELFEDGFELLGRIDRIVKLGDKRISLVAIEQDLQRHHWVADAYVALHTDKQRVAAWLALNEEGIEFLRENGRKALIEGLKKDLLPLHEAFAHPRYWRLATALPRNAQSKILRSDFEAVFHNDIREPQWHLQSSADSAVKNTLVFKGIVPLDLIYFKGHFTNFPLVPGVVELQWAIAKIPELLGRSIEIERIDNLKYQQFLRPNDEVELTLTWDEAKKRVKFQLKSNNEPCASGLVIFTQ